MSILKKIMKNVAIFRDVNGNLVEAQLAASAVMMADGTTTLPEKLSADAASQTVAMQAAVDAAVTALKTGDIQGISDSLTLLRGTVETFMDGEPDGGTIDRLSELIAEIKDNKDNIAAIVADNLKASDVVNDLTTGGIGKVLSAEQGKALKELLDALETQVNNQIASLHTHANKDVLDGVTANHLLLASKTVTAVPESWPVDVRTDGVLFLVEA